MAANHAGAHVSGHWIATTGRCSGTEKAVEAKCFQGIGLTSSTSQVVKSSREQLRLRSVWL